MNLYPRICQIEYGRRVELASRQDRGNPERNSDDA
jgi:hypothetical protein